MFSTSAILFRQKVIKNLSDTELNQFPRTRKHFDKLCTISVSSQSIFISRKKSFTNKLFIVEFFPHLRSSYFSSSFFLINHILYRFSTIKLFHINVSLIHHDVRRMTFNFEIEAHCMNFCGENFLIVMERNWVNASAI